MMITIQDYRYPLITFLIRRDISTMMSIENPYTILNSMIITTAATAATTSNGKTSIQTNIMGNIIGNITGNITGGSIIIKGIN
ncbi:MAG: hypothetical protein ACN4GR_16125 [Arenicellales bacterium]